MKQQGFTLIEVLVAVAILGIALLAVTRTAQQATLTTAYIQSKMAADFVATDTMARVQAGLITLPIAGGKQTGDLQMLGQSWQWQVTLDTLVGLSIDKITVTVQQGDRTFVILHAYVPVDARGVPILMGMNS